MYQIFKYFLFLLPTFSSGSLFANENSTLKPLEVGVVPYVSARALVARYEPMRLYLEQALGKPVKFYTAAGFKPFFLNAAKGD